MKTKRLPYDVTIQPTEIKTRSVRVFATGEQAAFVTACETLGYASQACLKVSVSEVKLWKPRTKKFGEHITVYVNKLPPAVSIDWESRGIVNCAKTQAFIHDLQGAVVYAQMCEEELNKRKKEEA
jgi:hypothetical protein